MSGEKWMDNCWLKDFFQSGFYEDYYGWHFTEDASKNEAEKVLHLLGAKRGHILDWCGGWGRHAIHFAKKGFEVTILDFVDRYLETAKQKFQEKGLTLSTIESDCRNTPPEIQADFAVCLLNSVGFLDYKEQLKAFNSLHGAMKPGGKIIIECMNLFMVPHFIKTTGRKREDGFVFRSEKSFDFRENVEHMVFEIISPTNEIRKKKFIQMHYSPHDLSELVTKANFKVENICGNFEGDPISFDSLKIVLVAQKPG